MDNSMRYPIGIQSYEKIRQGGYVYVDKTDLVYMLAKGSVYKAYETDSRTVYKIGASFSSKKAQLSEQKAQLSEQESMLRATIKLLLDAGKSLEEISSAIGKDMDTVTKLAK